jgi:hypothetical protein
MTNLNFTTTLALVCWPLVTIWLFKTRSVGRATLWTILGAYMFLPVDAIIKFPMIPAFDKDSIPNIAAFVACMIALRRPIKVLNGFGLAELLIVTLLITPFVTSVLNGDPVIAGRFILPGVGIYDAGSALITQFIALLPFFIGRQVLRSEADTKEILRVLTVAGLIYSLPMLLEVRLSPQLHAWIYGYFPHMFAQTFRDGGFRPVVFMGHGLLVAFFIMTAAVAAAAFWRTGAQVVRVVRVPTGVIPFYFGVLLFLCKTLSSLLYGVLIVPLVRFANPKLQTWIAVTMVTIALLYPTLRAEDLVPTDTLLNVAGSISEDRAGSLETRFTNERQLLEKASQRFYFGWGRFGRSRVYSEYGDISLTDGAWVIIMGEFGIVGFLATFGLLALPVFRAASSMRYVPSTNDRIYFAAVTLILAINLIDLLPNSSLRPWTWLLAGALMGRAEALRALARKSRKLRNPLPLVERSALP